ncbi:MAG: hypothetical protein ABIV48_13420 [Pyrinomonadaceae bacterium]
MNNSLGMVSFGNNIGIVAAIVFFVIFLIVAYIAFKLLRKTVKMALRLMIVGVILAVAAAGSIALLALRSGSSDRTPARPSRTR